MTQFAAHTLKITVVKGGADFGSNDDPALTVNGVSATTNGFPSLPTDTGSSR